MQIHTAKWHGRFEASHSRVAAAPHLNKDFNHLLDELAIDDLALTLTANQFEDCGSHVTL